MKAFLVQTVKHVSPRSGAETTMVMYHCAGEDDQFFAALGNDRSVVSTEVRVRNGKPRGIEHFTCIL